MDIKDEEKEEKKPQDDGPGPKQWQNYRKWRVISGLFIILIGCGLILQKTGYFPGLWWVFTWPMILIVVGVFMLIRHGFRTAGPIIPVAIGAVFLLQELYPATRIEQFIWPVVLITIGLMVILGKNRRCNGSGPFYFGGPGNHRFHRRMKEHMRERWGDEWHEKWHQFRKDKDSWHEWKRSRYQAGTSTPAGEVLDINAVFGGVKRTVLSKNFAGGEVNAVLGGCEIDLTKADINGRVVLEVNSVFGGTQLYVPPTWTVIPEMDTVFGSLEDKRPTQVLHPDPEKVLVLRGANVFGGTELSLR